VHHVSVDNAAGRGWFVRFLFRSTSTSWPRVLWSVASLFLLAAPVAAQERVAATASAQGQAGDAKPEQSPGDDKAEAPVFPDRLDGTLSAGGDLDEDYEPHTGLFRFPTVLDPYFAFKAKLRREYGIAFGGSYGVLWQNYSSTLVNEWNAVGSKFTLNLGFTLLNLGKPDALWLDIAIEDRRPLGTELAPLQAGLGSGSIVPTAATWGNFGFAPEIAAGITQFYLRQSLFNHRFQWALGKLFAPNFINAYPFFDDNRQFLNQTFSTSPTIASPLRGFGAVAAVFPTDGGLYLQASMFTALSSDTGITIDDFFTKNEHFYSFEVGWSGLAATPVPLAARGPMDANNFHVMGWYRNPLQGISTPTLTQPGEGSPEAYGVAFNAVYQVGENFVPFLRGGLSKNWVTDANLTAGFCWRPTGATFSSDLLGFGGGWARPSNGSLRSQYTIEAFYRFHLTPNFALTPDFQIVFNPSLNPTVSTLYVTGFRARVSF
jgi:hypothetical protein